MKRVLCVHVNGARFYAAPGDVLLDTALVNGVDIPHDCRSGQCGSCLVRVHAGRTLGGDGPEPDVVHACQARVFTDLEVAFERTPPVRRVKARVQGLRALGSDVVEVKVRLAAPLEMLPGQYCRISFRGFPARSFSPTVALDGTDQPATFRLHVRRVAGGAVSAQLGREIRSGHALEIEGPFGLAHFRAGRADRLVLFASGTGFAPIWAVADAALRECSTRPMAVIVGARALASFYMGPALTRMARCPNVRIIALTEDWQDHTAAIQQGWPEEFAYLIEPGDSVYAAGSPRMVEAVSRAARAAGVTIHADPFVASNGGIARRGLGLVTRLGALRIGASPAALVGRSES